MFKQHYINQTGKAKIVLSARLRPVLLKVGRLLVIIVLFVGQSYSQKNIGSGAWQLSNLPASRQGSSTQQLENSLKGNGMGFTPNKGQIADMEGKLCPDILYKCDAVGADIYLRKTGISYVYNNMNEVTRHASERVEELVKSGILNEADEQRKTEEFVRKENVKIHRVDMDFAGCNQYITTINEDELEGCNNYYYAHCAQGITNVKQYNKVTYKNIYNNIDIAYYGDKQKGIKYDLIVQPHADPNQIKLHWTGADNIHIDREGNLVIKTRVNKFYESIPKVYQIIEGKVIDIKTKYVLTPVAEGEAIVNFSFSIYNSSFPLIIDPWVTYYGGAGDDMYYGGGIATDAIGNVYVAGHTSSAAGIASGGFQNIYGGGALFGDAFLVKFNGAGNRIWATYYGGTAADVGYSVATDVSGNVYMSGYSGSTVGIAFGGFQNVTGGSNDAFLVKFDSSGARLWATYYGGTGNDYGASVATNALGDVYLAGHTTSSAGIASGGFQNSYGGGTLNGDAFLVRFNGTTGLRLWATYYGGTRDDFGFSVATDNSANVYLAGWTESLAGIASGGFQNAHGGSARDAFLVKFNSSSGGRIWATYYGGTALDWAYSVTTDPLGNVYMAGHAYSASGIASGGFQNSYGGGSGDAFLVKFNGAGARLWATYLGGSAMDYAFTVVVDTLTNDVYISGDTYSSNFPVTSCAWQKTLGGSEDGFVAHFKQSGQIVCSSYVGGGSVTNDENCHIALYGCYVYMSGYTPGPFPVTPGAFQTIYGGGQYDAFAAQLYKNSCGFNKTANLSATTSAGTVCTNASVNFTSNFSVSCDNSSTTYTWSFPGGTPSSSNNQNPFSIVYGTAGVYTAQLTATTACDTGTKNISITVNPCGGFVASVSSASMCSGASSCPTLTATGTSGTSPYTYSWSTNATTANINPCPVNTTNYTVTITDNSGLTASSVAVLTVNPIGSLSITSTDISCSGGANGTATANPANGTPGYTYSWNTGGTTSQISGLTSQIYSVTVTDSKGCTVASTVAIVSPSPFVAQFTRGTANCNGCGCKEWLMINATGGTSPYSYTWPDGYVNRYKNQLCPGAYTINIKDKNGCSVSVAVSTP